MENEFLAAARATYPPDAHSLTLGAPVRDGECSPEPLIHLPISMMNRHGLIAGATGTGKTRTVQLLAEQLSAAGVPVFLTDVKGDLSGIAVPGEPGERVTKRAVETGWTWKGAGYPTEYLSVTGKSGAQLRATVSSFGPLLLSKILELNQTQTSVLTLVFKFSDDRHLPLLDFSDLRAVLQYLSGDGASELANYGGMSKATVGVLLREMLELEQQGAQAFFGEPEFRLEDLLHVEPDGRGRISTLELADAQDKPALWSTFVLWMLARLYHDLPEVGDVDKPKLVFFFDEAHLLFDDASEAFLDQVEQVIRLVRSKGVGVFFITQNPKDVPSSVLGQLGHRVQHALRAFTPDDEKALRAAARTVPKTAFYDVEAVLTSLGIGEALVTVLSANGVPTQPFATRIVPPGSRMGPLTEPEMTQRLAASAQVQSYAQALDRESARELLAARFTATPATTEPAPLARDPGPPPAPHRRTATPKPPPTALEQIMKSPVTRTVAGAVTRGLLGALLGRPTRRRRY